MAATVEGLFKIIDGASGPMQRMERQAKKTDSSIESLGERLDNVGSDKQLGQMDDVDRQIKTIDRDARTFSGDSGGGGRLRKTLSGAGDDSDRLSSKLGRVGISLASIGRIFQAMKLPLIVSGIVALVQGVSALLGGAVALIPKLTDLAGVAGAMPATFLGIGIGVAATKLAFSGLGRAIKGTKGAMAELTPRAREFVRVLKEMKPISNQLKSSAQAGLFPGLTSALQQLKGGVPTAQGLLKRGGETVGGIADRAAGAFTQKGFLKDLESVGGQGLTVLNRLGSALINVVEAFRHVAVAAMPFTNWISATVLGWSQMAESAAKAGRETGGLREYFERTRQSLEQFGSIAHNIWDTLVGIGKAARPLGDELWGSADKATERWANFANSLEGQAALRNYFDSLKANLQAIFTFTGELGKAFMRLGGSGGFVHTMEALTRAIEPLEHLFSTIGAKFGPALAVTLEQLIRLFDNLGGGSSVLVSVVELLNMFLEAINALLDKIPGLSNLITGVLGAFALRSLSGRIMELAASWGMVATNAGRATVAQRGAAAAAGGTTAATVFGGAAGRRAPLVGPQGRVFNTRPNTSFIAGTSGPATVVGGAGGSRFFGGAGIGGAAMGAAAGLGRFFWPIAAFSAAAGAATTPGNLGEKIQGGLSQGSFGIIKPPVSPTQQREEATRSEQERIQQLLGHTPKTRPGIVRALAQLRGRASNLRGDQLGLKSTTDPDIISGREAGLSVAQMRAQGFDAHNDTGDNARLAEITKALKGLHTEAAAQSKEAGAKAAEDFSKAWAVHLKHGNRREAGSALLQPILGEIQKIGPQGAKILGQSSLDWYRQAAKDNPKLKGEYQDAARAIERAFANMGERVKIINGQIYSGTGKEWSRISEVMATQAERARQEVSKSFTKLQEEAVGALRAMGYSPTQAKNIVKGMEAGGSAGREARSDANKGPSGNGARPSSNEHAFNKAHGYARGGRVRGFGNQDRYALGGGGIGAAGELMVNKHTEKDANSILARYGMTLGGMVGKEGRPHSELTYARGGRRPTGGGIESVGGYASGMGLSVSGGPGYGGIPSSGHVGDSLHYSGLAYDVSGAPALMSKFRRAAEARYLGHGLNELFYDPFPYFIDQGQKQPGAIGGHSDHVHIGFFPGGPTGASAVKGLMGAAGAGAFKALKSPKSGMGGVPGAMANAGMASIAGGLNKKLAKAAALKGVGVPGKGGVMPKGSGGGVEAAIARVLFAHGLNKVGAAGIIGNAFAESTLNPAATGYGGGGLWGFTSSPYSLSDLQGYAAGRGSPWTSASVQTQFLLKFIGSLIPRLNASSSPESAAALFMTDFEKPGIPRQDVREAGARTAFSHGYSKGGRLPDFGGWFGQGGSIEASKPTMIGIGDGGTEVATVRHKSRGTAGGGGSLRIGQLIVQNHRPGDVKKQVKKEVHEAVSELAKELDLEPDTSDEEVLH